MDLSLLPSSRVLVGINLLDIGNTIGKHVKSLEATKQRKYTSYEIICVYMNISKSLPGSVTLE
jgi:hypothetical protein